MRIAAVINQYGQPAPLERFKDVICMAEPEVSVEEKAAIEFGMKQKVWPWFGVKDGIIELGNEGSRWFLGGRAIQYYECRRQSV
jgi:hypothetical protein